MNDDISTLHEGKWISLCTRGSYEFVKRNNSRSAVFIVGITENSSLIIVRQKRLPVNEFVWEPPAGLIDKDETPEITAERELFEETGYRGVVQRTIMDITSSPGMSAEMLHAVLITDCVKKGKGGGLASENENIETDLLSLRTHEEMQLGLHWMKKTGIIDMKLYAAIGIAKTFTQFMK